MIFFESINLVPQELAESVRSVLINRPAYRRADQLQENFYKESQETLLKNKDNSWFPNDDESYTAKFDSHDDLLDGELVQTAVHNHILPKLKNLTGIIGEITPYGPKIITLSAAVLHPGDHYRLHKDDFHCDYGFIWYLSKNWKWDWGGLLINVKEDGTACVTRPIFNKVIFLKHHEEFNNWHCITTVESYSKEPRIALLGFIKC